MNKTPEEIAREILASSCYESPLEGLGVACGSGDDMLAAITAAIENERKERKQAEKWMRHRSNCTHNDDSEYFNPESPCTCGLDEFRKGME